MTVIIFAVTKLTKWPSKHFTGSHRQTENQLTRSEIQWTAGIDSCYSEWLTITSSSVQKVWICTCCNRFINTHHPLPKIQVHFPWQNDKNLHHPRWPKIPTISHHSHHSQNSFTWESCWERPQPTNPQPGLAWHRPVTWEKCCTSYAHAQR